MTKLVQQWNAWRQADNHKTKIDLCGANLCEADLCEANLRGANLRGANLCGANLCEANLRGANLRGANLCGANLCEADMCGANLCEANLRGANLCEANWLFQITGEKWQIIITKNQIQIGCKVYPAQYWMEFNDITIRKMDTSFNCVEWWHENKEFVRMCYNKCAGRWHWDRI